MKLTTNYSKSDWIKFSLTTILQVVIPLTIGVILLVYLVLPMIEMMPYFIEHLGDGKLIVELRDVLIADGYNLNYIIIYYIFTLAGGTIIPTLILFWVMTQALKLGEWISHYHKLSFDKDLIILNNGEPIKLHTRKNSK